jgi:type IV pilus assembly protein PilM
LAQLLFGVDIGSKYTKVVVLEHGVKTRLVNGFLFPTPSQVSKGGDKQVDPEAFIKALTAFIPAASFRRAKIAVNLPPMSITALSVFLPLMSRKELSYAAINEAKQKMIPVAGPNHIFDCLFLGETRINKVPRAEVLVIRTEKLYVQRIIDIFKGVEEFPALISPASTILPNVVPKDAWKKDQAVVIVDIGAAYLKISISSDANMVFMRNIVFGLEDIIQDFAKQLGITAVAAEEVIKEHGIPIVAFDPKDKVAIAEEIMRQKYEASLASPASPEAQVNLLELRLLWQPYIERIAQELRRSLVFYNERSEGRRIEQIFFTGGGSYIKNLRSIISSFGGGECKDLLPFAQIPHDLPKDNKFKDEVVSSAIFASAASLAFGIPLKKGQKEVQINFLPAEFKEREAKAARRLILLIIWFCFVGVFILLSTQLFLSNHMIRWNIQTIEKKLTRVQRVSEDLKSLDKSQSKIKQRSQQIEDLINGRLDYPLVLEGLAKDTPEAIVLSKCTLDDKKLDIEGNIFADYEEAKSEIDLFGKALSKKGYFGNIVIPDIELEGISPELNPGVRGDQLRLTQPKERNFKLSADVVAPKIVVAQTKLPAVESKTPASGQKETEAQAQGAVKKALKPGAPEGKLGGSADNPEPVWGATKPVLSVDKSKVKKKLK